RDSYYLIGSTVGPHPYPMLVRDFQAVIGREARAQFAERESALPDAVVACVGGGSNALGIFQGFLDEPAVRLFGVEAAGDGCASAPASSSTCRGEETRTCTVSPPWRREPMLAPVLERLRNEGRTALIPYVTAGHPDLAALPRVLSTLERAGADVVEIGVPFS